jgi:hypothetical protein
MTYRARLVRRVLVSLPIGIVAQGVVLLGILATAKPGWYQSTIPVRPHRPAWLQSWPDATSAERYRGESFGLRTTTTRFVTAPAGGVASQVYVLWHESLGWPLSSLGRYDAGVEQHESSLRGAALDEFLAAFQRAAGRRVGVAAPSFLPVGHASLRRALPIWPELGLVLNPLIFATAIFTLGTVPGAVRHQRRRRCGLCIVCGYELQGSVPCPECGTKPPGSAR